jgi:hypothetical protein
MSKVSGRSSDVSEEPPEQRVPDEETGRDLIALPPTRLDGLVLLWHEESGEVDSILGDYE